MADDLAHLSRQHALLNRLLAGEVPTLDLIHGLLDARVEEDLHLDYKSGAIAEKERKKAELGDPVDFDGKLQKHVAGFANSEGGVLIVGVGEPPKKSDDSGRDAVDRSKPRAFEPLPWSTEQTERRAREAVGKLAVSLHPPPRIKAVEVASGGSVLVVATARAEGSVFCLESQQAVYYLRMHDSTRHAPAYLLDDIRLGRRRRPSFDLSVVVAGGLANGRRPSLLPQQLPRSVINVQPTLTNTGVVWMKSVRLALVLHSHGEAGTEVPGSITPYLELRKGPSLPRLMWYTASQGDGDTLAPFQRLRGDFDNSLLFLDTSSEFVLWAGAMLVVCEDQPPTWHQLAVYCRRGAEAMWWLLPAAGRRPVVALHESEGVPGFVRWSNQPDWFELEERGGGGAVNFTLKDAVG